MTQMHQIARDHIVRLASGMRSEGDENLVQVRGCGVNVAWQGEAVSCFATQTGIVLCKLGLESLLIKFEANNGVLLVDDERQSGVDPLVGVCKGVAHLGHVVIYD